MVPKKVCFDSFFLYLCETALKIQSTRSILEISCVLFFHRRVTVQFLPARQACNNCQLGINIKINPYQHSTGGRYIPRSKMRDTFSSITHDHILLLGFSVCVPLILSVLFNQGYLALGAATVALPCPRGCNCGFTLP